MLVDNERGHVKRIAKEMGVTYPRVCQIKHALAGVLNRIGYGDGDVGERQTVEVFRISLFTRIDSPGMAVNRIRHHLPEPGIHVLRMSVGECVRGGATALAPCDQFSDCCPRGDCMNEQPGAAYPPPARRLFFSRLILNLNAPPLEENEYWK